MDTWTGSLDEPDDWVEEKHFDKYLHYENHRSFLKEYSKRKLGRLR